MDGLSYVFRLHLAQLVELSWSKFASLCCCRKGCSIVEGTDSLQDVRRLLDIEGIERLVLHLQALVGYHDSACRLSPTGGYLL